MSWLRYNGLRESCPVCGNIHRKDCRKNLQTGLVHCRDELANPSDYVFRGLDSIGFGMWAYNHLFALLKVIQPKCATENKSNCGYADALAYLHTRPLPY